MKGKRSGFLVVVVVALVTLFGSIGLIMLGSPPPPQALAMCWPGTSTADLPRVDGLTDDQVAVAAAIWRTANAEAHHLGGTGDTVGDEAAVIAIAVANQESTLGANPDSRTPNRYGNAGIFQQRTLPGWHIGLDEANDPVASTRVFLLGATVTDQGHAAAQQAGTDPAGPVGYQIPGLAQVEGWQTMSAIDAAHTVQRSEFPTAVADDLPLARQLVTAFRQGHIDNPTAAVGLDQAPCAPLGSEECTPTGLTIEAGLTPDALRVLRCLHAQFPQIQHWAGIGDRPAGVDDHHQTGKAIDAMIPDWDTPAGNQLGDHMATWLQANAETLGVVYIIWDGHIWSVARASEGWRLCGSPQGSCYAGTNPTLAHRDHVHISVHGYAGGTDNGGTLPGTSNPGTRVHPVRNATITARWGQVGAWSRYHTGVDFAAPIGTPVLAAAGGTITHTGFGGTASGWAGHWVSIRHDDGTHTLYAHLGGSTVPVGQRVTAGQPIGVIGMTGRTFGPHLHFELYPAGRTPGQVYTSVDPLPWLSDTRPGT